VWLALVKQNGLALEYAPDFIKDDYEVVKAAYDQIEGAVSYASERLQKYPNLQMGDKRIGISNQEGGFSRKKNLLGLKFLSLSLMTLSRVLGCVQPCKKGQIEFHFLMKAAVEKCEFQEWIFFPS